MTTRGDRNDTGIVRSVCAGFWAVFLYLVVVTAAGITDDWQQEMEVIFPEEEFSRFSDCLYLKTSTECIAYVTISEFNITVDGVAEDRPRADKQTPCTYFTCDSNIIGSEGELICHRQEESTVCNNRSKSSFSREPVKTRRGPTCAVLFLSEEFEIFTFDQLSSFESCTTSCLCETPASTTQTIAFDVDTSTVKPFVADGKKTTETTIATTEPSSVHSAQNISSNTAVTTITVASTENSTDNLVSPTTTTSLSVPIDESAVTKETVEAGGNNDTLVANDTNVTSQTATFVTVGVVFAVVAFGVIVAGVVCYFRRRAAAQRPTGHEELEMINIPYERSSANVMRQCCRDNELDPDTYSLLVGAAEDTTTSHV